MQRKQLLPGKNEIFDFIDQELSMKVLKIEQLGDGLVYCKLFEKLFPTSIETKKLKYQTKQIWDSQHNLKILEKGFQQHKISKQIDVERLSKCKFNDNFTFAQWFMRFYEENIIRINSHPSPLKKIKTQQDDTQSSFSFFKTDMKPIHNVSEFIFKTNIKDEHELEMNHDLSASMLISPMIFLSEFKQYKQEENQCEHLGSIIRRIDELFQKIKTDAP